MDSLTQLELESLGFMLCRQSPLQWKALWTEEQFSQALPYIGGLGCKSNEQVAEFIYEKLFIFRKVRDTTLNVFKAPYVIYVFLRCLALSTPTWGLT